MRKVSQANLKNRRRSKWTVKVYYIQSVNASTISFYTKIQKETNVWFLKEDVRDIIKTLCAYKDVEIVEGVVCPEHVHLCVCISPKLSVSQFMGYLKGKSALRLYDKHQELGSKFNKSFWARRYYVAIVGSITETR